jgi:galactose mutarotase-like enzyme
MVSRRALVGGAVVVGAASALSACLPGQSTPSSSPSSSDPSVSEVLPTGKQFTISRDSAQATITEVGATLRTYTVDGLDVLDPFAETQMSDSHGQILIPFPNRIAKASYQFAGTQEVLPINQPSDDAAIHGLVRWLPWRPLEQSAESIVMVNDLFPSPGYPFALRSQATFTLTSTGLEVEYHVTNIGIAKLPLGIGTHPYFTVGTANIDTATLTIPAKTMLVTNSNGIPTGRQPVNGTEFDFREPKPIGKTVLDTAYTDLIRDPDGVFRVTLEGPDGKRKVEVELGASDNFVQVYSSDTLPDPDTYRASLAIEPMTCPANAFNSKDGLIVLQPGESHDSQWSVRPTIRA